MKKILFLLLFFCFLSGCSTNRASDAVESYLMKFKNHDEEVLNSLEELISIENLSTHQQEKYTLVMKRQYQDLKYKTTREYYNGDEAIISEEIEVYDYIHSKNKAKETYLEQKDSMNKVEYQELQLDSMLHESKRIKYTIDFELHYQEDGWHIMNMDYTILQKIHGIYSEDSTK